MQETLEIAPNQSAMADVGVPVVEGFFGWDEHAFGLDDLPPDPMEDSYDPLLGAHNADPADDGSMRAAIFRVVSIRSRMSALQADEHRELARLSEMARKGVDLVASPEPAGCRAKDIAHRSMVAELAAALRVSDRTVASRVADAELMVSRFPFTLQKLATGSINAGHVRVITENWLSLGDDQVRAEYESIVLQKAVGVTPGRLRRTAELTAARLGNETFQERHDRAAADRNVRVVRLTDGMSEVIHVLPTVLAVGIWDRLTAHAKIRRRRRRR